MAILVECRPGYQGEPEPFGFWLGERRLAVLGILDRWFGQAQRWVKVEADDGHLYVLRCDETTGAWELAAFTLGG